MGVWAKLIAVAAAFALLLAAPARAQVPDPFARELARKLVRAEAGLREQGYARAAGPFAGGLNERESRRLTLTLRAGQSYRLIAVCDERCGELGLRMDNANGRRADGAAAALDVRPESTGQYNIEITMRRCAQAPCWYAVNAYSR